MLKTIEMSEEQINNCIVFLNRTTLNGQEAEALVMVKQSLMSAKPKDEYVRRELQQSKASASAK